MIDKYIESLHKRMTETEDSYFCKSPVGRRLYALSVISNFSEINQDLKEKLDKLDCTLDFLILRIDCDKFLDINYWKDSWLLNDCLALENEDCEDYVERFSSYLPHGIEGYQFTKEKLELVKNALRHFGNSKYLTKRDIQYAVKEGLQKMMGLLAAIKEKIEFPPQKLVREFWNSLVADADKRKILGNYKKWKRQTGLVDFQHLKDKQTQVLATVLSTDFLRFRPTPTKGKTKSCKFAIDEDSLEMGFELPYNIEEQCARFDSFIIWKDRDNDYVSLDYVKIGQYIYQHFMEIGEEINTLIECDIILDAIHEDMAELKPELKKYLKHYDEDQLQLLIDDCATVLNTCQVHLKDSIRPTFITEFLNLLVHDPNMQEEVISKLSGKSRNKFLCQIISVLDYFRLFKNKVDIDDLALSLTKKFNRPNRISINEYIREFQRRKKDPLFVWSKMHVELLKRQPFSPI